MINTHPWMHTFLIIIIALFAVGSPHASLRPAPASHRMPLSFLRTVDAVQPGLFWLRTVLASHPPGPAPAPDPIAMSLPAPTPSDPDLASF